MSLYMIFHSVSDENIDYLEQHPSHVQHYFMGTIPEPKTGLLNRLLGREIDIQLPDNWPTKEEDGICPDINHRMVEHFHYVLNGTRDLVSHAGCVFQTWFRPHYRSVAHTLDGENFGIKNAHVKDLKQLLANLSPDDARERYKQVMDVDELSDDDADFLQYALGKLLRACDEALEKNQGLVWTM